MGNHAMVGLSDLDITPSGLGGIFLCIFQLPEFMEVAAEVNKSEDLTRDKNVARFSTARLTVKSSQLLRLQ